MSAIHVQSPLIAALLLCCLGAPLHAQDGVAAADRSAVLAVVQRMFDAMSARDTVTLRALLAPGSRFVSIRGDTGAARPRATSDSAFLRSLGSGTERLLERTSSPVVQLRGPLATVWAPYDFHRNGQRSHCGVDAFTLVRADSTWCVTEVAYTVERTGCPVSPLGPPR